MSELINKNDNRSIRLNLLTGVSALALVTYISPVAYAENSTQPLVWIELGGQLSRLDEGQEIFSPAFPNSPVRPSIFAPSQKFEGLPPRSIDETGKVSFQSDNSDWVFSASVRYGRSVSDRHVHQQTYPKSAPWTKYGATLVSPPPIAPKAARFADTIMRASEDHLILDFQVGKDVGLGMFGAGASSVLNLGVRFAQFSTGSNIALKSDPDWQFLYKTIDHVKFAKYQPYHSNVASLWATRSFHGVGPSISWNAAAPFLGNVKDGKFTIDWGFNAAMLFGRQAAKTHHQTTGKHHPLRVPYSQPDYRPITFQGPATPDHTRMRTVTVPNVGGFAGLSFQIQNFKVSAGYRADLFSGAMDGGIDTAKKENVGFYGPFATVSVGIGG